MSLVCVFVIRCWRFPFHSFIQFNSIHSHFYISTIWWYILCEFFWVLSIYLYLCVLYMCDCCYIAHFGAHFTTLNECKNEFENFLFYFANFYIFLYICIVNVWMFSFHLVFGFDCVRYVLVRFVLFEIFCVWIQNSKSELFFECCARYPR